MNKTIVLFYVRDTSGCSHARLRWLANHLNANSEKYGNIQVIVSLAPIFDEGILAQTKAIVCQRFISNQDVELIRRYKTLQPKFGYKLIWEIDDLCWTHEGFSVPDYNPASLRINPAVSNAFRDNLQATLPLYDTIHVSTDYLKHCIEQDFNVWNVKVVRNVVPKYLWNCNRKEHITTDLVKPKVLYSGSPTHYRTPVPINTDPNNPTGVVGLTGDWTQHWIDFIKDAVRNDKIEFTVMGCLPFFFEDIADKIKVYNWVDCNNFPGLVQRINADIQVAPIVDNVFNKCKSALRFYESCAVGNVLIANDFIDSPYNVIYKDCKVNSFASKEDIANTVFNMCKKDNYNAALDYQYNFIEHNHHYIEDETYINNYIASF